jgi:hypothetical protein
VLGVRQAASRVVTWVVALIFGVVVLVLAAAGGLAWRLTDGPLDVTRIAARLAPIVAPDFTASRLTVELVPAATGHALRLDVTDGQRQIGGKPVQSVRSATLSLALAPLLTGRLEPTDIGLDGLRLHIAIPQSDGRQTTPDKKVERLVSRLQHVTVTDAQADFDGGLGQAWTLQAGNAEITRDASGILHGHADATASSGGVTTQAQIEASYGRSGGQIEATLPSIDPATLAHAVPALAAGGALDATVALHAQAAFGPDFAIRHASVHAETGAGTVQLPAKGGGTSPGRFTSVTLDADGTPAKINLQGLRLVLRPPSGSPPSTIVFSGAADRTAGSFTAHLAIDIDHVAFADLGSLWPQGVGGDSRMWLTENLTAGTAHDGHFTLTLTGADSGDGLDVTQAGGSITGDDVTIWWLRPVPPVQHAHAVLVWQTPDVALITATGGRQGAVEAKTGTIRITGLAGHDQVAFIDAELAGPLNDVLTLLKNPRLQLLSKRPLAFTSPTGTVGAHLSVRLPLEAKVTVDQVAIHANGQVANTHLGNVALGRDLDQGQLAFDVTNDGLTINGPAQFSHIPAQLAVQMDFKNGPKTQVLQHITAGLRLTKADADKAGLGYAGLDGGVLAAAIDYAERRDDTATIQLDLDLKDAKFITPLGWSKAAGAPGHAQATVTLDHGRLVGLDNVQANAPGLAIKGRSDLVNGRPSVVHLERGEIGRSNATGTIVLPQREGEPFRITLTGPQLDLEGRLTSANSPAASNAPSEPGRPGTPYAVDLRFERVVLGPNHGVGPLSLTAAGDGHRLTSAKLTIGGRVSARAELVASAAGRRLDVTTDDFGALLQQLDLADELNGGDLHIEGHFDDRLSASPFNGTFDLRGFKVQGAPVAGKLLQALTVYGIADALRGPGLAFDRLETPFRLQGSVLDVEGARAFSSSLGFTATGRLDFGRKTVDLRGTIVPAYFFNSLPGRIPLIGQMFSPEKGSGLFAANYSVIGPVADPSISINPLSALTPGFTRRFFDLFD